MLHWTFPDPATPLAADTLHVHNLFMAIITTIFVAVLALVVYSLIQHRRRPGHRAAAFTAPRGRKQVLFTLAPFAGLLFIDYVVFGVPAYHAVLSYEDTKSNAELVVKVTGSQWKWIYEYPDHGIKLVSTLATPREQIAGEAPKGEHYLLEVDEPLVVPAGRKIRFVTTSTDVIHSWWVPAFGVKRDAIPGFVREFWASIDTPGTYRGQCAELCGRDHGFMPVVVQALPPEQFDRWVAERRSRQLAAATTAQKTWSRAELLAQGKTVYEKHCAACHQPDGRGLPPAFPALAGNPLMTAAFVDPAGRLVRDGHLDRVLNGKPGTAMPAFRDVLSDAEIAAVLTYERVSFGQQSAELVQPNVIRKMR